MEAIEKCVLYIDTTDVASRSGAIVIDGKYKVPVTLPKLKCLEDQTDKYFPYLVYDSLNAGGVEEGMGFDRDDLSVRERQAFMLFKQGVSNTEIAKELCVSSESVRMMLARARRKFEGTKPAKEASEEQDNKEQEEKVKEPSVVVNGRRISPLQLKIYEMHKNGHKRAEIAEALNISRDKLRKNLKTVFEKMGEPFERQVNQFG